MKKWMRTLRAKLKKKKEHFKNFLGNSPEVTDKPIKNYYGSIDKELQLFMEEGIEQYWKKIKSRKAADLDEIPPEEWKTKKFNDILLCL